MVRYNYLLTTSKIQMWGKLHIFFVEKLKVFCY